MSKVTNPERESSVSCGFFNSSNDRKYDAIQMSRLFDGIINDGIFASIGTCFVVKAESGNMVNVGVGKAWFNHTWTENDAILPIECEKSELLLDRIDAIVIEVNANEEVRDNFIKAVKGVPSSTPVRPKMIDTNMVHQHACCYIYRRAGSTEIRQADITNVVGTDETPFVTGPLQLISLDELLGQWKDKLDRFIESEEFDFEKWYAGMKAIFQEKSKILDGWTENKQNDFIAWFNHIRDQLDSDQAGHLQNQLTALKEKHDKDIDSVTKKLITLTVTTDDDKLIGDSVKVTKDSTTLEQTFDASKSLTFHLPELGTWKVTNTNPDHSGSSEITCEMYGRYSVALSSDFIWKKWVTAGGLSVDGYTSLADVLADEKAVRQLVTKHASANILAKAMIKNRAEVRAKIAASKNAMKWIGLRDYICDKLLADAETQEDLLASDHWRYILKDGVPYMTSDTAPYGTATNGGTNRGIAYKAFINDINDGPDMGYGNDGNIANTWVQYKFVNPICVKRIRVKAPKHERYHTKTFKIQYSNDGSTFKDIESNKYVFTDNVREIEENVNNDCFALYWRVQATSTNNNTKGFFTNVQFYGRSLNVSVPAMTSDTTPWGKIIYSSQWDGGSSAGRQAFSGADSPWYPSPSDSSGKAYIGYVYPTPTRVRQATFICHNGDQTETCVVERSDDGERWEKASDEIRITVDNETKILNVDASPARYWRIRNVSGNIYVANHGGFNLRKVQFYGVDYSERDDRAYIYDHGMELTPLNVKITDGTIPLNPPEKKETYIQLTAPSGKSCGVGVAIDVTNLKRLRAVTDQGTFNVGAEFGRFFATTEGNTQAYIAYASASAPPYNHSLDLTSITGVKTLVHLVWSGLSTGLSEMWLE